MHAINIVLHIAVSLLLPPLLQGVIVKTKARFAGRIGAPYFQPYYDLIKLFRKDFVISSTTTWVFLAGTVICLAATVVASLLLPFGHDGDAPISFAGDMILFAYLFALSRFFMTLTSLDTGSPFEGMGAAREVTFACLAEPTIFFGLLVLSLISQSQSFSLHDLFGADLAHAWNRGTAALPLILVAWFIVLLAENSRIPFDDPNTHLELTMIHEVIILDHGGPLYGMMLYGAWIKLFLFISLLVRVAIPFNFGHWIVNLGVFLLAVFGVAVLIGVVESTMARLRMTEIPKLLATACVLSALAILLLLGLSPTLSGS